MIRRKLTVLSICSIGLGLTGFALAQQKDVQVPKGHEKSGHRSAWHNPDQMLATCVAIGNQEEIAIAKLAEGKADHKEVKEFASMMIKDHQEFLKKLEKYAPEATRDGYLMEKMAANDGSKPTLAAKPKAESADDKESSNIKQVAGSDADKDEQSAQRSTSNETSEGQSLDFVQLHKELAVECIQAAKQGMSKKEGAEFDECFIGYQIAMHAGMKNKLVVYERHVSGDLKKVFAAGIETTEMHMKKAEQIMKKLADDDSSDAKDRRDARREKKANNK